MTSYDTIVVGAGHNGLIAGALLARAGQRVVVLEAREAIGGAAATEEVFPGFRVDRFAHRIGGVDPDLLRRLGISDSEVRLLAADPCSVSPTIEGESLTLWRDPERTATEIARRSASDAKAWPGFVQLVVDASELLAGVWDATPPDVTGTDVRDLATAVRLGHRLRRLGKRRMTEVLRVLPMSIYELVDEWFEDDLVRGTLAGAAVLGLCQGPMSAGTALSFLHHQVRAGPVIRPMVRVEGGIGRLAEALANAVRAAGGEVRTEARVEQISVGDDGAAGVVLEGGDALSARRVVSSLDPRTTLFGLVDPSALGVEVARKVDAIRFRGVTAKVHLALRDVPRFSAIPDSAERLRGATSISPSLEYVERAYDAAKYGKISEAPYLEVSIPSLSDPTVAPTGAHLASIVVQYAPYSLTEGEWDDHTKEGLAARVISTVAEYAPGFDGLVEASHVVSPRDLERDLGMAEGNIYHGEMTLDQLLFMRPIPSASRYRSPIAHLWMCGAGTHPGGGVIGAPGANAAREILRS